MKAHIKKAIKHFIGRDLWIRPDVAIETNHYGTEYGGWSIQDRHINKDSTIYSFGVGEDASFDIDLIKSKKCVIHAFDPTPKSIRYVENNINEPNFILHQWAIGTENGELKLWLPDNPEHVSASLTSSSVRSLDSFDAECRTLQSIMDELEHSKIDILKIDIEGAEYGVIAQLCNTSLIDSIDQFLVEFHHRMEGFTKAQTLEAIEQLRRAGKKIAWVSDVGHECLFI